MNNNVIYSIGYGNRKVEEFIDLLKQHKINFLLDVRSQPYSKFNPQFNQADLKFFLESHNIKYVFMGDTLGGRPKDLSCYDDEGKVDYQKVQTKEFYKQGLERVKKAYRKSIPIVIMCSESKPCDCHRAKLIGMSLFNDDEKIIITHIDENGKLKDQATVMNELSKGKNPNTDLFSQNAFTTSRKSYL